MPLINNIQNGFGLDIGDRSIKLLRLEAKKTFLHKKKFIVKTFAEIEVPEGAIERGEIKNESAVVSSLKSLLKEAGKLPSKTAVVSLPETKTFLKTIKIVAKEKKELQAKIIDMLPQTLPVSLEEIYFDWQIIETKEIEDRETEEQRDRRTEGQKNRGTEEQRDRRTEGQKNKETEEQRDRETEGQKNSLSSDLSDKEKKTEKSSFTKTSKDKEYSIFLVAAPKTTVDNFLKLLNLADISPVALESETTALSRALLGEDKMNVKTSGVQRTSGVNTTKNKVIIDLGATQTSLILTEKSVPKISISLAISGNNLTDMIAKKLKITFKEAENLKKECGLDSKKCDNKLLPIVDSFIKDICKKIYEALKTYPGILENKKREPIILSGGGANMIKLDSVLSKNLKIKARKGIPDYIWNIRSKNEKFNKSQLGASTVIGLALRATLYPFPKNH